MKKIDKIIQSKVQSVLNEQKADLIPIPGNSTEKYDKTNKHVVSKINQYTAPVHPGDYNLTPWPKTQVGLWKHPNVQRFLNSFPASSNAAPIVPLESAMSLDGSFKATVPDYIWNFGSNFDDAYIFKDNGTMINLKNPSKYHYWYKWLPKGAFRVKETGATIGPTTVYEPLGNTSRGALGLYSGYTADAPLIGWLYIETDGQPNIEYFKSGVEAAALITRRQKEADGLEILSWFGFAPGYLGASIDALSAMIYFSKYERDGYTFDLWMGLFTLVAIIPGGGSVMVWPVKKIFQKYFAKRAQKDLKKALAEIMAKKTGKMSAEEIDAVIKLFNTAASVLSKNHEKLAPILKKYGYDNIDEALVEIERYLYSATVYFARFSENATNRLAKQISPAAAHEVGALKSLIYKYKSDLTPSNLKDLGREIGEVINKLDLSKPGTYPAFIKDVPKLIWEKISSAPYLVKYGKYRQQALVKNLETAFRNGLKQDPDKFKLFILMSEKNASATLKETIATFTIAKGLKEIDLQDLASFKSSVSTIHVPKIVTTYVDNGVTMLNGPARVEWVPKDIAQLGINEINNLLKQGVELGGKRVKSYYDLEKTNFAKNVSKYVDNLVAERGLASQVDNIVTEEIKGKNNVVWAYVLSDPLAHWQAFSPKSWPDALNMLKANFKDFRKWVDTVYAGIHEFAEDLGWIEDDKVKSLHAYEFIKSTMPKFATNGVKWVGQHIYTYQDLTKQVVGWKSKVNPNSELPGYDRDSTWRPLPKPAALPGTVSSTTNIPSPNKYVKSGKSYKNVQRTTPTFKANNG